MAKLFVLPKRKITKAGVITCEFCEGTGSRNGEECPVCQGTPEIDWASYAALVLRVDDLRKQNRKLVRLVHSGVRLPTAA